MKRFLTLIAKTFRSQIKKLLMGVMSRPLLRIGILVGRGEEVAVEVFLAEVNEVLSINLEEGWVRALVNKGKLFKGVGLSSFIPGLGSGPDVHL